MSVASLHIQDFLIESNGIEGINRRPTINEIQALDIFLEDDLSVDSLIRLQAVFAPGFPIRSHPGMNVGVGSYIAPAGGETIIPALQHIIDDVKSSLKNLDRTNIYRQHVAFQLLHPFMDGNGRTGRALWAWHMMNEGQDPFALSFLHRFYYQTLEAFS